MASLAGKHITKEIYLEGITGQTLLYLPHFLEVKKI
jgi:hypothetical protein